VAITTPTASSIVVGHCFSVITVLPAPKFARPKRRSAGAEPVRRI